MLNPRKDSALPAKACDSIAPPRICSSLTSPSTARSTKTPHVLRSITMACRIGIPARTRAASCWLKSKVRLARRAGERRASRSESGPRRPGLGRSDIENTKTLAFRSRSGFVNPRRFNRTRHDFAAGVSNRQNKFSHCYFEVEPVREYITRLRRESSRI